MARSTTDYLLEYRRFRSIDVLLSFRAHNCPSADRLSPAQFEFCRRRPHLYSVDEANKNVETRSPFYRRMLRIIMTHLVDKSCLGRQRATMVKAVRSMLSDKGQINLIYGVTAGEAENFISMFATGGDGQQNRSNGEDVMLEFFNRHLAIFRPADGAERFSDADVRVEVRGEFNIAKGIFRPVEDEQAQVDLCLADGRNEKIPLENLQQIEGLQRGSVVDVGGEYAIVKCAVTKELLFCGLKAARPTVPRGAAIFNWLFYGDTVYFKARNVWVEFEGMDLRRCSKVRRLSDLLMQTPRGKPATASVPQGQEQEVVGSANDSGQQQQQQVNVEAPMLESLPNFDETGQEEFSDGDCEADDSLRDEILKAAELEVQKLGSVFGLLEDFRHFKDKRGFLDIRHVSRALPNFCSGRMNPLLSYCRVRSHLFEVSGWLIRRQGAEFSSQMRAILKSTVRNSKVLVNAWKSSLPKDSQQFIAYGRSAVVDFLRRHEKLFWIELGADQPAAPLSDDWYAKIWDNGKIELNGFFVSSVGTAGVFVPWDDIYGTSSEEVDPAEEKKEATPMPLASRTSSTASAGKVQIASPKKKSVVLSGMPVQKLSPHELVDITSFPTEFSNGLARLLFWLTSWFPDGLTASLCVKLLKRDFGVSLSAEQLVRRLSPYCSTCFKIDSHGDRKEKVLSAMPASKLASDYVCMSKSSCFLPSKEILVDGLQRLIFFTLFWRKDKGLKDTAILRLLKDEFQMENLTDNQLMIAVVSHLQDQFEVQIKGNDTVYRLRHWGLANRGMGGETLSPFHLKPDKEMCKFMANNT